MEKFINTSKDLFSFIEKSTDAFHAVKTAGEMLEEKGFTYISEKSVWNLESGKYYTKRNNSSLLAFEIPEGEVSGFNIVSAHTDSPNFKVKELSDMKVENNYTKLNTEPYGGMIMASWLDRALGISGRILLKTENGVKEILVDTEKEYCIIPNLAIHMQRDINDGHKYNPQVDMLPLIGDEKADLGEYFANKYGFNKEDILSHDLFLYPMEKGRIIGNNGEFIACSRLDDLQCAYSAVKAICESEKTSKIKIAAIFDNEEVGSGTKQGADGSFLFDLIERICECKNYSANKKHSLIAGSFMVSADNAHAVHPNFTGVMDQTNRNYLNKGIVIKFNANQKYTTDGVSSALFKSILNKNEVPFQIFHNRSDMRGGSTLGNISNSHVSLNTIDIGVPQLAMHSAYETAGIKDTYYMVTAMKGFFESDINFAEGEYTV
ncbi:MAG: M18 family aminopeptidase [Ruminococcaceae bacterium]|nr:M18 family aminopeptidase [Oscillospiraceae bacterium]